MKTQLSSKIEKAKNKYIKQIIIVNYYEIKKKHKNTTKQLIKYLIKSIEEKNIN